MQKKYRGVLQVISIYQLQDSQDTYFADDLLISFDHDQV